MIFAFALVALLQLVSAAPVPQPPTPEVVAPTVAMFAGLALGQQPASQSFNALANNVPTVLNNAVQITSKSWEYGALFEALLEVHAPELTPFGWNPAAFDTTQIPDQLGQTVAQILSGYDFSPVQSTAANISQYLSANPPTPLQPRALLDGAGSLGDPAAVGFATWLLAMFADKLHLPFTKDQLAWATANQLQYLRNGIKDGRGCISQREKEFQLWSDMGYMIPPFLASLGLATHDAGLLDEALTQWMLVSDSLNRNNLYIHITGQDEQPWATGNGWMLAGLMRVIGSIRQAGFAQDPRFASRIASAEQTAANVFKALFAQLDGSDRLPAYMLNPDPTLAAADSAGTAMVVAAYYRFLVFNPPLAMPMRQDAERAFNGVVGRLDGGGWLNDVVNPDPKDGEGFWVKPGIQSPEGQAFTALMYAARDAAHI